MTEKKITYTLFSVDPDTKESSYLAHINANSISDAYDSANGDDFRIMPSLESIDGVALAAIQLARSSSKRALTRGAATTTERTIYNDLTHVVSVLNTYPTAPTIADVETLIGRTDPNAQDFYSLAKSAVYQSMTDEGYVNDSESGYCLYDIYASGYKAISAHIRQNRTRAEKEVSTAYIAVNGGDLVSITAYTAKLVGNGERYTPDNHGDFAEEQHERLARVISDGFATLRASHKKTAVYLAKGLNQSQIAEKEGVTAKAVNNRVSQIRNHLGEYISEHEPEFAYMVETPTGTAKENSAKGKEYQKEYKQSHKKEHSEYMKEYMKKRRAEQKELKALFENKQDK